MDALAEYVVARTPHWSDGWATTVEGFFRRQVVPHFTASRVLSDITRPDVETFQSAQLARLRLGVKKPRRVKPATVNRLLAALAAFGEWSAAPDRAYLLTNPFAKHAPFPEDQTQAPKISEAALDTFLAELPERRKYRANVYPVRAVGTLAVDTGLRKSELERLAWIDIDLDERRLWVISTNARGHNKGRKIGSVALTSRAVEVLEALPRRSDGLVFGPLGNFKRSLRSAAAKAGVPSAWFHVMRHWGANRVSEAGATFREMMDWGRWSNARMPQRYTRTDHGQMVALADRVGKRRAKNVRNVATPRGKGGTSRTAPTA